jgi:cytochrome c2
MLQRSILGFVLAGFGIGLLFVGLQFARAEGGGGVDGKAVYEAKKCSMCHVIDGKGGKMGPDLSDIGSTQTAEWFEKFLKNPKSVKPDAKMSAMKGTDEEIHAVASYMASLKAAK